MYIGGHGTNISPYSGHGFLLEAGEAVNLDVDNIGKVRACAVNSGDRVTYIAIK